MLTKSLTSPPDNPQNLLPFPSISIFFQFQIKRPKSKNKTKQYTKTQYKTKYQNRIFPLFPLTSFSPEGARIDRIDLGHLNTPTKPTALSEQIPTQTLIHSETLRGPVLLVRVAMVLARLTGWGREHVRAVIVEVHSVFTFFTTFNINYLLLG